jgi:corrinoid protein of di/trimethylamine methyltransferase
MTIFDDIRNAIVTLDADKAQDLTKEAIDAKKDPGEILNNGIIQGIREVGEKFEKEEYFLAELIHAADITKSCIDIITPHLPVTEMGRRKKVVIATVKGDIHTLGKDLVSLMLRIAGFDVVDLGADVATMDIIDEAEKVKADVIGLSALMMTTMPNQAEVIKYLNDMGLREKYKVMVGGGSTTKEWAEMIGADGWAPTALAAVTLAEKLTSQEVTHDRR